jgi:hypothetical protein
MGTVNLAVLALDILQRRGRKALVDLTDQGHILVPEPAALLGRPSSQGKWRINGKIIIPLL